MGVFPAEENCPEEMPDEVIYDVWKGTQSYCDNISSIYYEDPNWKIGNQCIDSSTAPQYYDNDTRFGYPPIILTDIGGFRICGKRDGNNFLESKKAIGRDE